jgi:hypothetical protein
LLLFIPFPGLQSVTGQAWKWGLLTHTDIGFKYFAKNVKQRRARKRRKDEFLLEKALIFNLVKYLQLGQKCFDKILR